MTNCRTSIARSFTIVSDAISARVGARGCSRSQSIPRQRSPACRHGLPDRRIRQGWRAAAPPRRGWALTGRFPGPGEGSIKLGKPLVASAKFERGEGVAPRDNAVFVIVERISDFYGIPPHGLPIILQQDHYAAFLGPSLHPLKTVAWPVARSIEGVESRRASPQRPPSPPQSY